MLVPIDFSYTTFYRLSPVTFALKTHRLATIHNVTDDGRNSVPIARPLVRSANKAELVLDRSV